MITLTIIFTLALIIAIIALVVGGIAYVFWPVLIVLAFGLLIDILVIRSLFKRKK